MEEETKETGGMEDGLRKMEKRRNGKWSKGRMEDGGMEDGGMEEISVLISDEFYGCL